jgi:hypothetical protein
MALIGEVAYLPTDSPWVSRAPPPPVSNWRGDIFFVKTKIQDIKYGAVVSVLSPLAPLISKSLWA